MWLKDGLTAASGGRNVFAYSNSNADLRRRALALSLSKG